jgi:hypothetical protein
MLKRTIAVLFTIASLLAIPASVAQAASSEKGKLCVVKQVGKLHIQFGYCP